MTEYHKINAVYKRYTEGPNKGRLIEGDWAVPEIGYLANNEWEFTEKVDGTNIRVMLFKSTLIDESLQIDYAGRTDNADIPKPLLAALDTFFVEPDKRNRIETWMDDHGLNSAILYGEGYGPKIQSGGNYRDDQSFVLFDVKIGDFWLDRANVNDVAEKLGIDSVPVIDYGTIYDAIAMVKHTSSYGGLKSMWHLQDKPFEAEGIVARPVVPLFNRQGNRIIAKIKARDFR